MAKRDFDFMSAPFVEPAEELLPTEVDLLIGERRQLKAELAGLRQEIAEADPGWFQEWLIQLERRCMMKKELNAFDLMMICNKVPL